MKTPDWMKQFQATPDAKQLALNAEDMKESKQAYVIENGIPVLPSRGEVVSHEHVQRIMREEGI